MNKYMGFFELKSMSIPSVPWKEFRLDTVLDESILWAVRVAVEKGMDLNLPRAVGVTAGEAYIKGREMLRQFSETGMVIYYPYFAADKSGVMDIKSDSIIIEAVDRDLWNLVTEGRKNVTIHIDGGEIRYDGDENFLSALDISTLQDQALLIRGRFRDILTEGKSIIAEWSFAYNSDIDGKPYGDRYLIFYELRSI
jgi:hypothetical protein